MTNAEAGTIEYDGTDFYLTNSVPYRAKIWTGTASSAGVNSIIYSGGSSFNSNVRMTGMNGIVVSGNSSENMIYINPQRGPYNMGTGSMVGWWYGAAGTAPRRHINIPWKSGETFQYIFSGTGYGAVPENAGKLIFIHTGVVNGKTIRCSFVSTGIQFPATNGDPVFSGEAGIYSGVFWEDEFMTASPIFPGWVGPGAGTSTEAHVDVYQFTCINKMVFGKRIIANAFIPGVYQI
jgi:hypothetical protein